VCIGHSHVRSIGEAAQARNVPLVAIDFWKHREPVVVENGRTRWNDTIRAMLGTGPVFSLIGGACHHTLGLLVHPRRFDFVLPSAAALPVDRAEIIPFDAVKAALTALMDPYLALMEVLARTQQGPVFHLEPPPVYADEQRLAPDLPKLPLYSRYQHEGMNNPNGMGQEIARSFGLGGTRMNVEPGPRKRVAISPRHLRYKLWRLHSEILVEFCQLHRITFVSHPRGAVDADGFLREPYYANPMHANAAYGDLVLSQMQECIDRVTSLSGV
jgi:hypothetical protein